VNPRESAVLRREAQALVELAALRLDPIFLGVGLPRGDGRLVLVLPGLFGNDLYLQPLRGWLQRLGYRPLRSTIALNAGCPNRLREQVETELRSQMRRRSGPISIVGHSRGGILAWALAGRLQEEVASLALLGSPAGAVVKMLQSERTPDVRAIGAHSAVAEAGRLATRMLDPDCDFPSCGCAYPDDLRRSLSPKTRVLAVCSRDDGIVPPSACPVQGACNVEVGGTHSGLVYNRAVYRELAAFLAERA
jgi:pimeloyl-ACP methyl ester carboxylesterase